MRLTAQTAKERSSTMAQDKTLGQGKGLSMDPKVNKEDVYQGLFEEARKQIALVYLSGTMAYIKEHDHALYDEVLIAEMRLEDLWRSMREGKDTLEQFEEALTTWKAIHLMVIDLYRKQRDQEEEKQRNLF
jgi:hypothetical protein